MKNLISCLLLCIFGVICLSLSAQQVISLTNPSFEDFPHRGTDYSDEIRGWHDCGRSLFPSESPPDIHPTNDRAWLVRMDAADKNTYLGMVVRANDSWESVSQAMSSSIREGVCYDFSIFLCRSKIYLSGTRWADTMESFTQPIVLRIWGGSTFCDRAELLAESPVIKNTTWREYQFRFEPQQTHRYITFEAFYKTPAPIPYNGNILLDGASEIVEVPCPGEEISQLNIVEEHINKSPVEQKEEVREEHVDAPAASDPVVVDSEPEPPAEEVVPDEPKKADPEPKILQELDRTRMSEGQIIRIQNLYFKADSSRITGQSYEVLDEIAAFMLLNPEVIIEIGGHTNTTPPTEYCDALSTDRAKAVKDYLVNKGVPDEQLHHKGYGKRQPIEPNDRYSLARRKKNQRVEIKVLSLNG